jgi:hypothetical protein
MVGSGLDTDTELVVGRELEELVERRCISLMEQVGLVGFRNIAGHN